MYASRSEDVTRDRSPVVGVGVLFLEHRDLPWGKHLSSLSREISPRFKSDERYVIAVSVVDIVHHINNDRVGSRIDIYSVSISRFRPIDSGSGRSKYLDVWSCKACQLEL
jgi:hypothetical protein